MDKYKIMKRLEYCTENKCDICQEENGSGFPWIDGRCYGFTERLYDALALLKAQEVRVMTLKEAQNALHNNDVVWVELKDKIICAGIRMDGTDYFTMQNNDVLDVIDFDSGEGAEIYGKQVRCWTSRPTDEQREAVKWE